MLVDPGSEGLLLLATLRGAGFDVELGTMADVARASCDVLVIAGDAPGSLTALRGLRDDGPRPDTKVVLVGAPSGMPLEQPGPSFGADWAISRADAAEELVAAVRRVALAARGLVEAPGLRERTLDLSDERSSVSSGADAESEREPPSGEIEVHRDDAKSDPARARTPEAEGSSIDIAFDARISPALRELLHAADRRVFPHLPPVEPGLPRGEAQARELAPEDLVLSPASEPEEEPALDSLTFVGAVPDARPLDARRADLAMPRTTPSLSASTRAKSVPPPPPEPRPLTPAALTPSRAASKTSPSAPSAKSIAKGATPARLEAVRGEGGLLVWLRALRPFLRGGAARLTLVGPELEIALEVEGGAVTELVGPIDGRLLGELEGSRLPEPEATAALAARERAGLLSPARRARLSERARRGLLTELLVASDVRFTIEGRPAASSASRPFVRRFAPLLCELAGPAFSPERVFALAGGEHATIERSASFAEVVRECELPLELPLALEAALPLASLLSELQSPGVLPVLLGLGGVEVRASEVPHPLGGGVLPLRTGLDALLARVEDADYFTVLGLTRSAGALDVAAAHATAQAELFRLVAAYQANDPAAAAELAGELRSARRAIDEARRVLSEDRWRTEHRRALEARSGS
jgi:hypothetical protein